MSDIIKSTLRKISKELCSEELLKCAESVRIAQAQQGEAETGGSTRRTMIAYDELAKQST